MSKQHPTEPQPARAGWADVYLADLVATAMEQGQTPAAEECMDAFRAALQACKLDVRLDEVKRLERTPLPYMQHRIASRLQTLRYLRYGTVQALDEDGDECPRFPHGLIDMFYTPGTIGWFTIVFDEHDPRTGSYIMLTTDHEARMFPQCTEGTYDSNGDNGHVGWPVSSSGKRRVELVMGRLSA